MRILLHPTMDKFIMEMRVKDAECLAVAERVHKMLQGVQLPQGFVLGKAPEDFHAFRIRLGDSGLTLSVSIPTCVSGNRIEDGGVPNVIETALMKDGNITYDTMEEYSDVCQFYSFDDLVAELRRLSAKLQDGIDTEPDE